MKTEKLNQNNILDFLHEKTGWTPEEIQGKWRLKELVDIRRFVCYYLYEKLKLKLWAVSEIINKDHATIIHHIKKFKALIKKDDDFQKFIKKLNVEI